MRHIRFLIDKNLLFTHIELSLPHDGAGCRLCYYTVAVVAMAHTSLEWGKLDRLIFWPATNGSHDCLDIDGAAGPGIKSELLLLLSWPPKELKCSEADFAHLTLQRVRTPLPSLIVRASVAGFPCSLARIDFLCCAGAPKLEGIRRCEGARLW